MKQKHIFLLAIFLMLIGTVSYGQKKRAITQSADEAFEDNRYQVAIERYQKAYSRVKNDRAEKNRITYQLAECYRYTGDYRKARAYYKRLIRANYERKDPEILLYYADIQMMNEDFEEAREYYKMYSEKVPGDPRGPNGVEASKRVKEWVDNPTKHEVEYIKKINSRVADFAPTYASNNFNDLIFTSTREGATGKATDEWTGQNFSDLFYTRVDRKNEWSEPILLTTEEDGINTKANEGAPAMSSTFKTLYFTRCPNVEKKRMGCQIYKSSRSGRSWSKPELVKLSNDSTEAIGHPTLSTNQLIIYFASDREGGFGGKDIWVAFRESTNEAFGRPHNIGDMVNTPGNEMFPFLRNDTILYFASDAHPGMGGLDLFYSKLDEEGNWSQPKNLQYPMNSVANDFAIVFHPEEERGFFSSDRRGMKGQEDIFSFIIPPVEFTIRGTVTDDRTLQFVEDAAVTLIGSDGISVSTRTNEEGFYLFGKSQVNTNTTYEIVVSKENYFNEKTTLTTVGEEVGRDFVRDFVLRPIPEEPIVLPEILYDLAKWNLKPQYEDSLQGLITTLDENPRIIVELASHTDARDTDERNDILSQKRAQSVVDYLVIRGIDPDRLVAKGYGERQPRELKKDMTREGYTFEKGTVLTEEYIDELPNEEVREAAHQLNRRTEFRVLSKDYIPKSTKRSDIAKVEIEINPEDNVVQFKKEPKTGEYIMPCIINGFNQEFVYDANMKAQVSEQKALDMLNKGIIDKEDFRGDPKEILGRNTIRNNAVFVVETLRIGSKTLEDMEMVVSQRLRHPIVFGKWLLEKVGSYRIDPDMMQLTFEYKE
ncbi:MAG: OmpA family protein [Bacteroidales bacterium]